MKKTETNFIDTEIIESRYIFSKEIADKISIKDEEGNALCFHKANNGNHIVFTKDQEGTDVAIEHCIDGSKIFHLSEDSKGLPAMHEFKPDGSELMYLLDKNKKLEKLIENKSNGDKITSWFFPQEMLVMEQRQHGGTVFKIYHFSGEAVIWLHTDGSTEANGHGLLTERLKIIFSQYLDGVEFVDIE